MTFRVGDVVWVDEGDSAGCYDFGGEVEKVAGDGTLTIRVKSHPIYAGAAYGSLRETHPDNAELDSSWLR